MFHDQDLLDHIEELEPRDKPFAFFVGLFNAFLLAIPIWFFIWILR